MSTIGSTPCSAQEANARSQSVQSYWPGSGSLRRQGTPYRTILTPRAAIEPKVVVDMGVMATLGELVLAIGNAVGQHQRIGAFFAHRPGKVGESVVATVPSDIRVANLVDHA